MTLSCQEITFYLLIEDIKERMPDYQPKAVRRVLKKGGAFALSLPSKIWADNLDGRQKNKTSFLFNDEFIETFSFTFEKEKLFRLLNSCGFKVIFYSTNTLPQNYKHKISPALLASAKNINVDISELPIVDTLICIKMEE